MCVQLVYITRCYFNWLAKINHNSNRFLFIYFFSLEKYIIVEILWKTCILYIFCFVYIYNEQKPVRIIYIHIPGQACFDVSRLISWASVGVEPRTLRFGVDVLTHYTIEATVDRLHATECSMPIYIYIYIYIYIWIRWKIKRV